MEHFFRFGLTVKQNTWSVFIEWIIFDNFSVCYRLLNIITADVAFGRSLKGVNSITIVSLRHSLPYSGYYIIFHDNSARK